MSNPVDDAGLSGDIQSHCDAIDAYSAKTERGSKRLSTISIVSSAIAAALTAGPAFGGRTFAETVQQGLELDDSSTVWRWLCFGAVVMSVTAGITTEVISKRNVAGHVAAAQEAKALLLKLERRLRRRELAPSAAVTEFEDIVNRITFVPMVGTGAPSSGRGARQAAPVSRGPVMATVLAATVALFSALLLVAALVGYGMGLTEEAGPTAPTAPPPPPATTAPPTTEPPESTAPDLADVDVFAGQTDGETATLAIVAGAGEAAAYVCDGADFEAWLSGTVDDGRMELEGPGGATLTGTIEDGLVSGDLATGRVTTSFVATAAEEPAGVYRAEIQVNGQDTVIGWAVVSEDVQLGIATIGGVPTGAPPLDLEDLSFTVNGAEHRAVRVAP
jgi:hypothetical protein